MATTTPRTCSTKVLVEQIGRWTLASIGARDLVDLGNGLMFRYGAGRRHTKLLVTLEADDTYTVRNVRLAGRHCVDVVELGTVTGVYADTLPELIRSVAETD